MSGVSTLPMTVALLLALAVLAASVRLLRHARSGRLAPGRCAGIVSLQVLASVLLFLVMFPPAGTREAGVLTVLTEGADAGRPEGVVVALPEYLGRGSGIDAVPDLATALRRHPGTTRIDVRGSGLPWRDHDAARGIEVTFDAADLPPGLAELHVPGHMAAGQRTTVHGRVAGVSGARVELRGPTDQRVAIVEVDDQGRFTLPLVARAPGTVEFALHVLDAGDEPIDGATLALRVSEGQATRVLLLAGAPGAELRALRRWAVDAGVALESRIQLSRDVSLGRRPDVEADELAAFDLLMLDERSWRTLDGVQRSAIRDAIRDGLGVLLRIGDVLDEEDQASLRTLGFHARNTTLDDPDVRLDMQAPAMPRADPGDGDPRPPRLRRRPLEVEAGNSTALLRSEDGEPLALWRGEGLGRVALWWLQDTHPLVRQGEDGTHASLWSAVVATLARAQEHGALDPGIDAGPNARRVLCGLGSEARVRAPDGGVVELLAGTRGCAAYWPEHDGWHVLLDGGRATPFHVAESATLHAYAIQSATRELASRPGLAGSAPRTPSPGSPWPWFLAFLATVAGLWALERRRTPSPASG